MFVKVLLSLALAQFAVGQDYGYGGGPATSASSSSSASSTFPSAPASSPGHINVDVFAGGQFVFNPAKILANVGDIVTFYMPDQPNVPHSVTQSSFSNPCTPLAANGSNPAGFDSQLQSAKTFSINITGTNPIWFHCKQILHCGMGMVGSINAPTNGSNTHEAFVAAAKAIGGKETPESSGTPVLAGFGAAATAPPSSPSTTTSASGGLRNAGKTSLYFVAAGVVALLI